MKSKGEHRSWVRIGMWVTRGSSLMGLLALCWGCQVADASQSATSPVPNADKEPGRAATFGDVVAQLSEPAGTFFMNEALSNENNYTRHLPLLEHARTPEGGVFIGVGAEQNLTFIATLRPRLAFILDIRRENMLLHLLYKSMFTDARTPEEWLGLLLGRAELEWRAPDRDIDEALERASAIERLVWHAERLPKDATVHSSLVARTLVRMETEWQIPVHQRDASVMASFLQEFYDQGLATRVKVGDPSLAALLRAKDDQGRERMFLGDAAAFAFVRELELSDRVVPVVGDFAGQHALAAIGRYAREHSLAVGAFYTSNVEQYLIEDHKWPRWTRNLSQLPATPDAVLLRTATSLQGAPFPWRASAEPLAAAALRPAPKSHDALMAETSNDPT